jgi:hypothetical protein
LIFGVSTLEHHVGVSPLEHVGVSPLEHVGVSPLEHVGVSPLRAVGVSTAPQNTGLKKFYYFF